MPAPHPNHLISIPRSIVSLKHYFHVHDQRFTRTALYLVILGLVLTVLFVGLGLIEYARQAPKQEARQARELEEKLAIVTFKDGKASTEAKQPCVLWQDSENASEEPRAEEPEKLRDRAMVVVLDTTGKLDTCEEAAEFAGCAEARRILLLGQKAIISYTRPEGQEQKGQQESHPYGDEEKLAELRKLVEEKGSKLPEITIEKGAAAFALEEGKVHVLLHTLELMVLVDTTGKGLNLQQAAERAARDNPNMRPPESLALISASKVALKCRYERAVRTLEFKDNADLSAPSVARWIPATARQARKDTLVRGVFPNVMKMLFFVCFQLFIYALICSVAGLIVSGFLRAGIPYTGLLTMAVYAMTPACLVLPFLIRLLGLGGQWVGALPFVVGMAYTALGTHRTARELAAGPAPQL